jgi:hypothetical protein
MLILAMALMAAAPQEPASGTESPRAKPAAEKLICKSRLKTGSRTSVIEICHTAAEWGMIKRENRTAVERSQAQNRMDRDPAGTPRN